MSKKKQRVVIKIQGGREALNARCPQIEDGIEPEENATYIAIPGWEEEFGGVSFQ